MTTFFTIGHSTHPIGEFIAILVTERIKMVVDVRTIPRSRTNPQFNADTFPIILAQHGIEYVHLAELGGLRGRQPSAKSSSNTSGITRIMHCRTASRRDCSDWNGWVS
jgi:uncharacterized protein (DUF488 family)